MKNKKNTNYVLVLLAIAVLVIWLFPYLYLVSSAFKPSGEVFSTPVKFFPSRISLENFFGMFERMEFFKYLGNSIIAAVCSTAIAVFLGSLSAYAIARTTGQKLSVLLLVLVLIMKMIPTSSIAVPIYEIIMNLKLYDTRIALIIVYAAINIPFVIWMMISFYSNIPIELDEAAAIDGASNFTTFRTVVLPIVMPGIASASIFTLFLALNDFLVALLLTSVNAKTFTVAISEFVNSYNYDLGPMMAGAFLFSFPVIIISIFAQKYIVSGMTSGSIK
jgi:multiple sugar transport system permease protein